MLQLNWYFKLSFSHIQSSHQAPLYQEFFNSFRESLAQVLIESNELSHEVQTDRHTRMMDEPHHNMLLGTMQGPTSGIKVEATETAKIYKKMEEDK